MTLSGPHAAVAFAPRASSQPDLCGRCRRRPLRPGVSADGLCDSCRDHQADLRADYSRGFLDAEDDDE